MLKRWLLAVAGISCGGVVPTLAQSTQGGSFGNLGNAALSNSPQSLAEVQRLYDATPQGEVIDVPDGDVWRGAVPKPDPNKSVTWDLRGSWPNPWSFFIGDGDLSLSKVRGSFSATKIMMNTKAYAPPISALLWNLDSNFTGPWQHNWNQMAPVAASYLTGATAHGNTSAITATGTSYGMQPSSAFDVNISSNLNKYGQNSTWGFVQETNDFSGRPPQAFASWLMELDGVFNGHDVSPMDPSFYRPQSGARVGILVSPRSMPWDAWTASAKVRAKSTTQGGPVAASVIKVTASDKVAYVWVCAAGGTTGAVQPVWPAPAVFTGSVSPAGVLTVTAMQPGSPPIRLGDVLTGSGFIAPDSGPATVTGQISGTSGGTGAYGTNFRRGVSPTGLYAAPPVKDGSAVWNFGTEWRGFMQAGYWFTSGGPEPATVGTVFGADAPVQNAVLDSSLARIEPGGAAVRLAPDQTIDFSSLGTKESRNRHALAYAKAAGALQYVADKTPLLTVADSGAVKSGRNVLDDGKGDAAIAGWQTRSVDAGITAGAASLATAAVLHAYYNDVTSGAGGVALSRDVPVGGDLWVFNRSGAAISVYPDQPADRIENRPAGSAIRLAAGADLHLVRISPSTWLR